MDAEYQAKILEYLVTAEKLGQEIICNKKDIILLDKRRNQNREAIQALRVSDETNCFITIGSVLIKKNVKQSLALLEADQQQLHIDINKMRSDLKVKVNDLMDIEMQPPVPGSNLIPLTKNEKKVVSLK